MEPATLNFNKFRGYNQRQPGSTRFTELRTYKEEKLTLARECSRLTKPLVVPPQGHNAGQPVTLPSQSHGARLVSNLVSQLLLILFPPGVPFFKLDLASVDLRNMSKGIQVADDKTMHDALRESFVSIENNSSILLDTENLREKLQMILQLLVVCGDGCYLTSGDTIELVPTEDWVCNRSSSGDLLESIIRQTFPVDDKALTDVSIDDSMISQGYATVYTRFYRTDGTRWVVDRYLDSAVEPFKTVVIPEGKLWVHIPYWELVPGEDYGRGPVEESLGDLRTYESGTQIVKDSATALAKVIFTVRPNGVTKASDVADADNTEIISGDKDDVGVIQANKVYDMSNFIQFLEGIKRELDITFMMPSVIRREAERVTAEEIRMMANEFEKSKGGTYNTLARNIQSPIASLLIRRLFKTSQTLSNLEVNDLLPIVTTGLQGLGRSLELENLLMFLRDIMTVPQMAGLIKYDSLAKKLAMLRGLEIAGLFKTAEELMAEQQQASMDEMARNVGPEIIKGTMNNG